MSYLALIPRCQKTEPSRKLSLDQSVCTNPLRYLTGGMAALALMRTAAQAELPDDKESAKQVLQTHERTVYQLMRTIKSADPGYSVLRRLDRVQQARDKLSWVNDESELGGPCDSELIGLYKSVRYASTLHDILIHVGSAS